MNELSFNDLIEINGGGLTLVEALLYAGSLASSGPAWPVTAIIIGITEYQDYKNGK